MKLKFLFLFFILFSQNAYGSLNFQEVEKLITTEDTVLIAKKSGKIVYQKNSQKRLIPASILKIFTSTMALAYLEENYRFKTEFYLDNDSNLKIKGYGDPFLTSLQIKDIAKKLRKKLTHINAIIIDDSFYSKPMIIDGVASNSLQPYDAVNGSLCVNFNTVAYENRDGTIVSGEKETPILDFIRPKLKNLKMKRGRILLSAKNNENLIYAGELFKYFLNEQDFKIKKKVFLGRVKEDDKLILLYKSPFSLKHMIKQLLKYSNNFIANQIFLNIGTELYGAPATLKKSVNAAELFAEAKLQIKDFSIVEGSGISRKNRITALDMLKILNGFEDNYQLLAEVKKNFFCKTGTLKGIRSRAGFLITENEKYRIIIIMNSKNSIFINRILKTIIKEIQTQGFSTTKSL